MPGGYRHGARSGCVIGGSGAASPACVPPPSAIYPGVRATQCRSGLCVERCHGCATRPDGRAKHRPCRHAVWPDVCVAGRQAPLLKERPQAGESACGNHVPEPLICSPPEAGRVDRRADGACIRACRGRWDWGRYAVRRGGGTTGRVDTRAFPLNLVVFPQVLQHGVMDALPHTGLLPCMQAPPATHAAAATEFTGKIFPRQAGLEDEQDTGQGSSVVNARTPAFGGRTMCWQQRLNQRPQVIRKKGYGHDAAPENNVRWV